MSRLLRATVNSWRGFIAAARSEAAFRQEVAVLIIAVPLAIVVAPGPWKRLALVAVVLLVLVVELLNTAIEKLADQLTTAESPGIGRIKDMGSAATLLALVIAGLVWITAVAERLWG
ncbi:MAG TPA: diacylglycerol kinase [Xanthobacteraceae bacterium]|nr:diacylglycerol kinase [Xanthobacteraceae bacterium]